MATALEIPITLPSDVKTLTCLSCRLQFQNTTIMKEHYKSDFHRFNLKRKVAGLAPVPEELFAKKLAEIENKGKANKGVQHLKNKNKKPQSDDKTNTKPESQIETNKNTQQAEQPKQSEQPKQAEQLEQLKQPEPDQPEEQETISLTINDSLFDERTSADMEQNIEYMTNNFEFFVPVIEYVTDLKGLMKYLAKKVSEGNCCLYCNKVFSSLKAVRSHMIDAGHTKMKWFDNEEEYADFYDLDAGEKRLGYFIEDEDGEEVENVYISENNELVILNKGVALGNRSLKTYYKQNTKPNPNYQITRSIIQEHKRRLAMEYEKGMRPDREYVRKENRMRGKVEFRANRQPYYRASNPL